MVKRKVFIGSSLKYLILADSLKKSIDKYCDRIECVTWSEHFEKDGAFQYTFEALLEAVYEFEYAIFFISRDYELKNDPPYATTPNVWYEAGMWMSRYGKANVFLIQDRADFYAKDILYLSDLTGLQPQYYVLSDTIKIKYLNKAIIPKFQSIESSDQELLINDFEEISKKIERSIFKDQTERSIPASTNLTTRERCYAAAERIIKEANQYVYTVISYENELEDQDYPEGLFPYIRDKIQKLQVERKYSDTRLKKFFKRWMNLANDEISLQAATILEQYPNQIEIRDTYCRFIEVVITESKVLLLLPNPEDNATQVGRGILINSVKIAQEFTQWFNTYLPEPNDIVINSLEKLNSYRDFNWKMSNKRNGNENDRCNSCYIKWNNQTDRNLIDALINAKLK